MVCFQCADSPEITNSPRTKANGKLIEQKFIEFLDGKSKIQFTADVVSNDDSKAIEEVFDITSAALPWLKK